MPLASKKALCKLSGESLAVFQQSGYDQSALEHLAKVFLEAKKVCSQIGIVIGAGNLFRAKDVCLDYPQHTLDEVGMLATIMNGKLLAAALEKVGLKVVVLNAFSCSILGNTFSQLAMENAFASNAIVIFTGGTGHPFFTTDTAAALRALQMNADVLVKLSTVDGIYAQDPKLFPKAQRYKKLTYKQIINNNLDIMDLAAIVLCQQHNLPLVVADFADKSHLAKALAGQDIGTFVTNQIEE